MSKQWKRWLSGVVGLALVLPIAGFVLAEDDREEDDRPRAERRMDDENEPNRDAQRESAARDDDDADDARAIEREERVPRSVRRDRNLRDDVPTNVQDGDEVAPDSSSPSDLPPRDLPPGPAHAAPRQHVQGNCCCSSGPVVYSQNNDGYRSARANNGGAYRSFSYQGGEAGAVVETAPAPVYNNGYGGGYINTGRRFGGVPNGANWDRNNEHDSRNFSGSYGSRASLRHGR